MTPWEKEMQSVLSVHIHYIHIHTTYNYLANETPSNYNNNNNKNTKFTPVTLIILLEISTLTTVR